jgi:hypothetical protein
LRASEPAGEILSERSESKELCGNSRVGPCFPDLPMTRDVGDDQISVPLPSYVHPISSQVIPDWRRVERFWLIADG